MKQLINPGTMKPTLTLIDNVVYSHQTDLDGAPLDLKLSVLLYNGNSEMKLAAGADDSSEERPKKPALVWLPGGGWRGADKNLMLGEMSEYALAGYVVVSVYYRSSAEGHFPAQLIDVKTAIRFIRAHAEEFEIDPERIGIFGRSAGAHLASCVAMNDDTYTEGEWQGYSSNVQVCGDMFGPTDVVALMEHEEKKFSDPNFRWHTIEETHGGALIGGDPATIKDRAYYASPVNLITPQMCPIQILHGDSDPIVPVELSSQRFYDRLLEKGLGHQTEFYVLKGAGHGTPEFFQDSVKELQIRFFDRYLK